MKSFKESDSKYNVQAWVTHKLSNQHNVPKRIKSSGDTPDEVKQNVHKYFRNQGYEVHHVEHLG